MMSSSKFLDYEVALLMAKYGRSAVLRALARKINMTSEELEARLQDLPAEGAASRVRKKPSLVDLVEQLLKVHPEKANALRALRGRFENRTFVPELRDVKRFFEQRSRPLGTPKSRVDVAPKLFKLLAELGVSELNAICNEEPQSSYSSLGVISDQILGKGR